MLRKLLHTALLLLVTLFSYADEKSLDTLVLKSIIASRALPPERVYLHFDNTAYYLGETMWFKAYVTSGLADEGKPGKDSVYIFAGKELLLKSVPTHAGVGTFTFTPK